MGGKKLWTIDSLVDNKFGRLLVISKFGKNKLVCRCDCGKEVIVYQSNIARKNKGTKSCGCLAKELSSKRATKMIAKSIKYSSPIESSAYCVWQMHYNDGDLSFEQFYELSQKNCYYCNAAPQNSFNVARKNRSSKFFIDNGVFVYNGLDRVNNLGKHDIKNTVPCCVNCNRAKSKFSLESFYNWVKLIKCNNMANTLKTIDIYEFYKNKSISNNPKALPPIIASAKFVWKFYKKDGLKFDDFLALSQRDCYYCGSKPSNRLNRYISRTSASKHAIENGWFIYNGLDRVDPNLPHFSDNIVTCCKRCNFAKSNMSQSSFYEWINNITIRDQVMDD